MAIRNLAVDARRMLPAETSASQENWEALLERLDRIRGPQNPTDPRVGKDNRLLDTYEGRLADKSPGLLLAKERELADLAYEIAYPFETNTRMVTGILAYPGEERSVRADEVADEDFEGINLRELAMRIAQTTPASSDGDAELLRPQDLRASEGYVTDEEFVALKEIERRYLPKIVGPQLFAEKIFTGPTSSATLLRTKETRPEDYDLNVENVALVFQGTPGSKISIQFYEEGELGAPSSEAQQVLEIGPEGTVEAPLAGERNVHFKVVEDQDGMGLKLPRVTHKRSLELPPTGVFPAQ